MLQLRTTQTVFGTLPKLQIGRARHRAANITRGAQRAGKPTAVKHMLSAAVLLLALGGVAAGCLYTPDANGHVLVPGGVTSIGDTAFEQCKSLVSVAMPNTVSSIGYRAFEGATSLASIAVPDELTSIGGQAFLGCTSLASVALPDGLTSIGNQAFRGCISIALVYVPPGCLIGDRAFEDAAGGYVVGREPQRSYRRQTSSTQRQAQVTGVRGVCVR